uniref:F-box domain-containing protein n=1 Tax=Caenorhabditis tropicalis TaxID=1561998 RepID=A0A1I7UQP6_9PELO
MNALKLLEFPILIQHLILKSMSKSEVLCLSFVSLRTKEIIRTVSWKAIGIFYDFRREDKKPQFILELPDDDYKVTLISFDFLAKMHRGLKRYKMMEDGNVFNFRVSFDSTEGEPMLEWIFEDYIRDLSFEIMHCYLCNLFKAPNDLQLLINREIAKEFPFERDVKNVFLDGNYVDSEDINKFFDKVEVSNCIWIRSLIQDDDLRENSNVFKSNTLHISNSRNLKPNNYNKFQGIHAVFSFAPVKEKDLVAFIYHWKESKNTKLQSMVIHSSSVFRHPEYVKSQFIPIEWDPATRPSHYEIKSAMVKLLPPQLTLFDCTKGFDIRRKDGRLATVFIERSIFAFLVWSGNEVQPTFPDNRNFNRPHFT